MGIECSMKPTHFALGRLLRCGSCKIAIRAQQQLKAAAATRIKAATKVLQQVSRRAKLPNAAVAAAAEMPASAKAPLAVVVRVREVTVQRKALPQWTQKSNAQSPPRAAKRRKPRAMHTSSPEPKLQKVAVILMTTMPPAPLVVPARVPARAAVRSWVRVLAPA